MVVHGDPVAVVVVRGDDGSWTRRLFAIGIPTSSLAPMKVNSSPSSLFVPYSIGFGKVCCLVFSVGESREDEAGMVKWFTAASDLLSRGSPKLIKIEERIECGFHRWNPNLHGGSRLWLLPVLRLASDNKMTSRMEIAFFYFGIPL
ncbi:hypothetical protein TanjilG_23063 [Lupinus angustifolius]|uniref:Uncharacterized protein n=1 Tax=Lupinus angustifolius TaxID=3871 RepID=A0A1J7FN01_LUPAN|nr:hypothetical protein TanjilG_23063 [Lupinus angustifolius]